jgi:hypothetical protein
MTTFATGNPLGSTNPKDLKDNAENIDKFANGPAATYPNRFGVPRKSLAGIDAEFGASQAERIVEFNEFLESSGFEIPVDYVAGLAITRPTQVIRFEGELYRAKDAGLPFTTTTWLADSAKLFSMGDAALRQELAAPEGSDKTGFLYGAGAAPRKVLGKLREMLPSPLDYDCVGNGIVNDTVKWADMESKLPIGSTIYLPRGYTFKLDEGYLTGCYLTGPGSVIYGDTTFPQYEFRFDPLRDALFFNPKSFYDTGKPGRGGNRQTIYLSPGATISGSANRCTFVGTQGPRQVEAFDRVDGFGNGVCMYSRFLERTTLIGTIAGQWLGSNNPDADNHNWWHDAGGFKPGDPSWDYQGMETRNPGIGAKIKAFNGFATQATDCGRTVGVGRDAFNGTLMATQSLAIGYRAAAGAYAVSNLTALGMASFQDAVFVTNSVAAGMNSALRWQEGERNAVFGYNGGGGVVSGSRNTLLGSFAGYDSTDLTNCIFIGHGAGNDGVRTNMSNVLAIGNTVIPLISGRQGSALVGINCPEPALKATLHIRSNPYGVEAGPHTSGDDLIVENDNNCGITIRSPNTATGGVYFADPDSGNRGLILYKHLTDSFTFRAGGVDRWEINAGSLNPAFDNAYSVGTAALRPNQLFAVTGTINTSDAREKTPVRSLEEAEMRAGKRLLREIGIFKWLASVQAKGADARFHVGMTVQRAVEILESEGLDPFAYGMVCFDEWDDEYDSWSDEYSTIPAQFEVGDDGVSVEVSPEIKTLIRAAGTLKVRHAGNRYAFREGQLHALMLAGVANTLDSFEERLAKLEAESPHN